MVSLTSTQQAAIQRTAEAAEVRAQRTATAAILKNLKVVEAEATHAADTLKHDVYAARRVVVR